MVAKELGYKNIILLEDNKELMEELKIQDAENFSLYSYAVANKFFIFDSVLWMFSYVGWLEFLCFVFGFLAYKICFHPYVV